MIDIIKKHIDHDYFIKLSSNKEKNICVVTMPANIVMDLDEITSIYELEDNKITIYRNKQKFLSKQCPNYAKRVAVWGHILRIAQDRNIYKLPVSVESHDKEIIEQFDSLKNMKPIVLALSEPELHTDMELEIKLHDIISDLANNRVDTIPNDIREGYNVSMNIFRGD